MIGALGEVGLRTILHTLTSHSNVIHTWSTHTHSLSLSHSHSHSFTLTPTDRVCPPLERSSCSLTVGGYAMECEGVPRVTLMSETDFPHCSCAWRSQSRRPWRLAHFPTHFRSDLSRAFFSWRGLVGGYDDDGDDWMDMSISDIRLCDMASSPRDEMVGRCG